MSLPNRKSLGPDGLSKEFFKIFQKVLSPYMQRIFAQATLTSLFPKEILGAYVVTLPKPGKDPRTPANFRPISLLNMGVMGFVMPVLPPFDLSAFLYPFIPDLYL